MHQVKKYFTVVLLLSGAQMFAQSAISGQSNLVYDEAKEQKIHLVKLDLAHLEDLKYAKEIANELFISLSTVKTHITNIYTKLKVSNRGELLRRFQN